MLLEQTHKFQKLLTQIDAKYTSKHLSFIKDNQNLKLQLHNPFIICPLPQINSQSIPFLIILLSKQLQESIHKKNSFSNFGNFVGNYYDQLQNVLNQKSFHCQLFCLAFIRCLQQYSKSKRLLEQTDKINFSAFIDLFSVLLKQRKTKKISKVSKIEQKQVNNQIHTIFLALVFSCYVKYVRQKNQQQLDEKKYLERSINAACLIVQQVQSDLQKDVVRDYLAITTHLLIFNGLKTRPIRLLEFCFQNNQGLYISHQYKEEIKPSNLQYFFISLRNHSTNDPQYKKVLLKTTKNLLTLNINNPILISHFKILLQLIQLNLYPSLKKDLFSLLIESLSKRNTIVVDQIFQCILDSQVDILDQDIQGYNVILAQNGDHKRRQKFTLVYYYHYGKSFCKIKPKTVNFILETYLQQNLPLQNLQFMISKEALIVTNNNINRLHLVVSEKSHNIHLNLLSIIIQRIIVENITNGIQEYSNLSIWLQSAKKNQKIYNIYLKVITQTLCNKSLDIYPALINLGSCIVKIQKDYFPQSIKIYEIILKMAQKYEIFEENVFRYMIMLQSIFGQKLPSSSYSYFSKNVSKIVHPQSTFLTYLQYLVTLLKNKASVLLYLQAVLQFQMNLNDLFFQKKLFDISFLARLVQESQFFNISTYSIESVAVIYQLSLLIKDQSFQTDFLKIIKRWSHLMTRYQCKNLSYFFVFREIKKIYPFIKERQMKKPSDRIKMVWDLLLNLIEYKECNFQYISMEPNKLVVNWKGEENIKRQIKVNETFIRNSNMELSWSIYVETTIKKYLISVNNDKIIVQTEVNRNSNFIKESLKQQSIKQLRKRPQNIRFQFRIENHTKKCLINLSILDYEVSPMFFQGNIKQFTISCNNNAILKQILITDGVAKAELSQIKSHIQTLNQWQVKIASLYKYQGQTFCEKFDYYHAYCCIGEMLRHFTHINLPFVYDIFIRLSVKLIKNINKKDILPVLQTMVQAFNIIQQTFSVLRGRNRQLKPSIQIQNPKQYPKQLYYLFTSALLPLQFWQSFSQQTRQKLINLINILIQDASFRTVQNNKIELFDQSLQICRENEMFFQVCQNILDNHQYNDILREKFRKFIYLAKQSSIYQNYLKKYIQEMLPYLNLQNKKYQSIKQRCIFLIKDYQYIKDIFCFCKIQSKMILLHYYSQRPILNPKNNKTLNLVKQLVQVVEVDQRHHLMPWLITEVKQLVFRKTINNKITEENKYNYRVHALYLELLLSNRTSGNHQQNSDVIHFVLELLKTLKIDFQQQLSKNQLQSFFQSITFIDFIKELSKQISQNNGQNKIGKALQIYQLSLDFITNLDKQNFLQFIVKYRYNCTYSESTLALLIKHNKFKNLPLSHFSIFLQYLFEILILIEHKQITCTKQSQLIPAIRDYVSFAFKSLQQKVKIQKPLFYAYPRLVGNKDGIQDMSRIMRRMRRASTNNKIIEMRGGIYFKLIAITIKLMKHNPNQNYSNFIQYMLFGTKKVVNRQQKGIFGFLDNLQNINFSKQKTPFEEQIGDVDEEHKLYFNKQDYPYCNKYQEIDLTNYITNYLLLNLAQFLQRQAENIPIQLLQAYSNHFIRACSNPKIARQLSNSNYSLIQVTTYQQMSALLDQYNKLIQASTQFSNLNSSPTKATRIYRTQKSLKQSELEIKNSPTKPRRRKASDNSIQIKRRTQIIQIIKDDCKNWYKKDYCKNISLYFCEKAKEIRVIQFIHTHFVLKSKMIDKQFINSNYRQEQDTFLKRYTNALNEERNKLGKVNLQQKSRKVKKIYPYTASKNPVNTIAQNCFANMACPITFKTTTNEYGLRRLKSQQSTNMNYYLSSKSHQQTLSAIHQQHTEAQKEHQQQEKLNDFSPIAQYQSPRWSSQFRSQNIENEESQFYCQHVTRQGVYFCQYKIQGTVLKLQSKIVRPQNDKLWYLKLGTPVQNILPLQMKFQVHPQEVVEIFYRKFNQITNNSLQFFMKNGTSKFISFYRRQLLTTAIKKIQKIFRGIKIIKDVTKQFEQSKFMQKWADGILSNFDYLMILNKYSGRTYNDLNQYYVFPWVLKDYTSKTIDLTNPNIYRDLSRPIGALNPQKLKRYQDKYINQKSHSQRCYYGSHYSTSLFLFYYLVRVQPYSSLHRDMQKDNWDVADRLFNSVDQVWQSLMCQTSGSDIKECIPQFYYMPTFLRNIAHIQLGQRQCGSDVSDVELPPWAGSAEQFIITMRAALQSDYVSQNLHNWIDLIFGKHQYSQQKLNIFHPYCYSDPEVISKFSSKDYKNIDGIMCQISYFGQCPLQLFKKQHKPKRTFTQLKKTKSELKPQSIGQISLPIWFKITNITIDYPNFSVQIQNERKGENYMLTIPANSSLQGIRSSIENISPIKKNENKRQNIQKITINKNRQLFIGKEFIMDIDIDFQFQYSTANQLWIACYGAKGICVYNWQLERHWSWFEEEVAQVHLQSTRLIFSTPNGKLYFFSYLNGKLQQKNVFEGVFSMVTKVMCLPRLCYSLKNQIQYKILCIGDNKKLSIVNHLFEQSTNYTTRTIQNY